MEPVSRKDRVAFANGPRVSVAKASDEGSTLDGAFDGNDFPSYDDVDAKDSYNEDGEMSFVDDQAPDASDVDTDIKPDKMTDEEIKVKALNQAIAVAKLMSDVDTDDVLDIAAKLAKFIKG